MSRGLANRCQSLTARLFTERQFYYRSGGGFRFVTVPRWLPAFVGCTLIAAASGAGYLATRLALQEREIGSRDRRIAEMAAAYDSLLAEYRDTQQHFALTATEFEEKYRRLQGIAEQHGALLQRYDATYDRLAEIAEERDAALHSREKLASQLSTLQERLAGTEAAQKELTARIERQTRAGIASLEKALRVTGLDVDQLLSRASQHGGAAAPSAGPRPRSKPQGGPFVAYADATRARAAASSRGSGLLDRGVMSLELQLARWTGLQALVETMPLARPVDGGYVSSSYGRRIDPLTRQPAMHHGLDIAAPPRTPIQAAAGGVVTVAGRKGPYGRLVEIDHGLGFKTRYGHLREILVHEGERVRPQQKIGIIGSSGRSTGTHLHYEVVYNGEPQDPANFIEAGNHVFKQQEANAAGAAR
jgi:murein DD-endopeptidase MepM/ murein hydrolase activator NlpD